MIRQDDEKLNRVSTLPYKEYACALFDVVYYAVMEGSYSFDRGIFLKDVRDWINNGILDMELTILNWNKLCSILNLPYRLVIENGTHKLPADRELQDDEIQLLYLYNPNTGYHHFVCGDKDNHITYDSLGYSVTGKAYKDCVGYVESKRVLRRV